ncbi:hypothetical protein DRH14_00965 [Candidatus Shapirobacteria bacterium]|nr:MAG: hypothetical protein DRH14_00965 [Candidatus Shapirobacteria bacterium]
MKNDKQKITTTSLILISSLFLLLLIAGIISYKHIDYQVLEKMEKEELRLPPKPTLPPHLKKTKN